MSVSSHRKLNVEQLINLAQVYWDDPTKLMEIRDATEGRVDAAAQLLFGAVSNRLDRLQRDPASALAEPTPDLAALIAERLGQKPGGPSKTAAEPSDGEDKKSRRRLPLVLAGLLLFLAAGAWASLAAGQGGTEDGCGRQAGHRNLRAGRDTRRRGQARCGIVGSDGPPATGVRSPPGRP